MTPKGSSLDERTSLLVRLHAEPPGGADRAELAGQLGCALLERYERDCDEGDLRGAVSCLHEAVQAVPADHPDGYLWFTLSRAYYLQRQLTGSVDGAAEVARCAERALQGDVLDDDDLFRAHLLLLHAAQDGLERDAGHPSRWRLSPQRYRQYLARGRAALAATSGSAPELRAFLAGALATGELVVAGHDLYPPDTGRVRTLLALAAEHPNPPLEWQKAMAAGEETLRRWAGMREAGTGPAADDSSAACQPSALSASARDLDQDGFARFLVAAAYFQAAAVGDRRGRRAAAAALSAGLAATPDLTDASRPTQEAELVAAVLSGIDQARRGEHAELPASIARIGEISEGIPTSSLVAGVAPLAEFLRQLSETVIEPGAGPAAPINVTPGSAGDSSSGVGRIMAMAGRGAPAIVRIDPELLRATADGLAELADLTPADHLERLGAAGLAGLTNLLLARGEPADQQAARQAARWWGEAMRLAGGPQHPLWSVIVLGLAESLRLSGSPELVRSRELGMSALRGHAWQVLRQAGTDYALEAARSAAADARTLAGWCRQDGATDELVGVLDMGRGLALNAAVLSRDLGRELAVQESPDLAAEWRSTAGGGRDKLTGRRLGARATIGEVPDDLRLRALEAISARQSGVETLDAHEPIQVDEVQTGLASLGADALLYLVPGQTEPGMAVVVPATGPVDTIPLPGLVTGVESPLTRYVGAGRGARDIAPAPSDSTLSNGDDLAELCEWAWTVAMGAVVDHVQNWRLHRTARLVVVPMGALGLVPWHAAYAPRSHPRRYAVQDLVISYSPSARMMCEVARRSNQPVSSTLVVGDPVGDLPFAGREARAIHRRFYSDGTYFGRAPGEAAALGTPDDVLAWVRANAVNFRGRCWSGPRI